MENINLERIKYYNEKNIVKNTNFLRRKFIRGCAKFFNYHPVFPNYAGRKIISAKQTNKVIATLLDSEKPFAICRFGGTELNTLAFYHVMHEVENPEQFNMWSGLDGKVGPVIEKMEYALHCIEMLSGFFPADYENLDKFEKLMLSCIGDIDLLGTWDINMEEYFIETFMPNAVLSDLYYLEPWFSSDPWSAHLKGKKVLVIHPFTETIQSQYQKREMIFPGTEVLPEFELLTLKAVQTVAGTRDERFETWFDALDYMYQTAMTMNFDVAIIGCGAYGMPLAVKLKQAGKQAIHLGGATQLLFGIKGARWEDPDYPSKIATLFNDAWVRPGESEKVSNSKVVENNCYW